MLTLCRLSIPNVDALQIKYSKHRALLSIQSIIPISSPLWATIIKMLMLEMMFSKHNKLQGRTICGRFWRRASYDRMLLMISNNRLSGEQKDCATLITCNIPHHNIDHLRHDLWCKIQRSSWQFRGCWMQYGENPINCSLWVRWGCLGIAAFGLLGANEFQLHLVSITPPVRLTSSQPNVAMLQWILFNGIERQKIKHISQACCANYICQVGWESNCIFTVFCKLHTSLAYFDSLLLLNGLWLDAVQCGFDVAYYMWFWCGQAGSL